MKNKREPILKTILYLANELFHLLAAVFSPDPSSERCSRYIPQLPPRFWLEGVGGLSYLASWASSSPMRALR